MRVTRLVRRMQVACPTKYRSALICANKSKASSKADSPSVGARIKTQEQYALVHVQMVSIISMPKTFNRT